MEDHERGRRSPGGTPPPPQSAASRARDPPRNAAAAENPSRPRPPFRRDRGPPPRSSARAAAGAGDARQFSSRDRGMANDRSNDPVTANGLARERDVRAPGGVMQSRRDRGGRPSRGDGKRRGGGQRRRGGGGNPPPSTGDELVQDRHIISDHSPHDLPPVTHYHPPPPPMLSDHIIDPDLLILDMRSYHKLEDAIIQVKIFLENVQRLAVEKGLFSDGVPGDRPSLLVTLIIGESGDGTAGGILRSILQRIFRNQEIQFVESRDGESLLVDALSGVEVPQDDEISEPIIDDSHLTPHPRPPSPPMKTPSVDNDDNGHRNRYLSEDVLLDARCEPAPLPPSDFASIDPNLLILDIRSFVMSRNLEDAIVQVKLFLENARQLVMERGLLVERSTEQLPLIVTLVIGESEDGSPGTTLRMVLQKIFRNRGIQFMDNGESLLVDALSGIHEEDPPSVAVADEHGGVPRDEIPQERNTETRYDHHPPEENLSLHNDKDHRLPHQATMMMQNESLQQSPTSRHLPPHPALIPAAMVEPTLQSSSQRNRHTNVNDGARDIEDLLQPHQQQQSAPEVPARDQSSNRGDNNISGSDERDISPLSSDDLPPSAGPAATAPGRRNRHADSHNVQEQRRIEMLAFGRPSRTNGNNDSDLGQAISDSQAMHIAHTRCQVEHGIQFRRDLERASEESARDAAPGPEERGGGVDESDQEALARRASRKAFLKEQRRKLEAEEQHAREIEKALKQSEEIELLHREEEERARRAEEELVQKLLASTRAAEEQMRRDEEDTLRIAMEKSLAEKAAAINEEELLEEAIRNSISESERRRDYDDNMDEMMEEVMRLSLEETELQRREEEEELRRAMEWSAMEENWNGDVNYEQNHAPSSFNEWSVLGEGSEVGIECGLSRRMHNEAIASEEKCEIGDEQASSEKKSGDAMEEKHDAGDERRDLLVQRCDMDSQGGEFDLLEN